MKFIYISLAFLLCVISKEGSAQYTVLYENSFSNYQVSDGWVMQTLAGDTSANPGQVLNNYGPEVLDFGIGKNVSAYLNKVMISPPVALHDSSFIRFFSNATSNPTSNPNVNFSFWVLPDPGDTLLLGQVDSLSLVNISGFNIFNLAAYANTTVRFVFKFKGSAYRRSAPLRPIEIDDLTIFDLTRHGYVPDSCFRSYLSSIIPDAFIGDSLNLTHEDVVTLRIIDHPNSCIESLAGIEYFPGLTTLNVPHNQIYDLPVPKLNYLDTFIVNDNYLEIIPELPWTTYIDYSYNLARNIPDFFNQYVGNLNVHSNQIYDCLKGSNRFADGSLVNNIRIWRTCCVYHDLIFGPIDYSVAQPECSQQDPLNRKSSLIHGKVYVDLNLNDELDDADYLMPSAVINVMESTNLITNQSGYYSLNIDSGAISLNVQNLPANAFCSNPLNTVIGAGENITHNFRVVQPNGTEDVALTNGSSPNARVETPFYFTLYIRNNSLATEEVTVKLPIPDGLTITTGPNFTVNGDTAITTAVLGPFQQISRLIWFNADTSLTNQNVILNAVLYNPGDTDASNDSSTTVIFIRPLLLPYDPNNKLVSTPVVDSGFGGYLNYTINFENIGTGNASHVIVRDKLSPLLDYNSFEFLGSTHPCHVTFALDSILQFSFQPITLMPTSVNPDSSTGSLFFRIKPLNPMNYGDTIFNSAKIIFDTQAPIITNVSTVWVDDSRIAEFNSNHPGLVCNGDTIEFNDLSTGLPLTWEWTFTGGNINSSVQRYPSVKYDNPGIYDVTLITRWAERSDTIFKPGYVTVMGSVSDVVTASGPLTFCDGGSVTLTAAQENADYNWSDGATSRSIVVTEPGAKFVTVSLAGQCSATSQADTIVVLDSPSDLVEISGSLNFCLGDSVVLSAIDTSASYLWSNGSLTRSITVTESGIHSVTLTHASGCSRTTSQISVQVVNYQPNPIIASGPVSFCVGDSVTLTASAENVGYLWSDGSTSRSITVVESGTHYVTALIGEGCSVISDTALITVSDLPVTSINGNTTVCAGSVVTLTADGVYSTYTWSTGESSQSISKPAGSYELTVTDSNGCFSSVSITVDALPQLTLSFSGTTQVCQGDTTTITINDEFASYQWSTNDTTVDAQFWVSDVYTIEATDGNNCYYIDSVEITVVELPTVSIVGNLTYCEGDPLTLSANQQFETYSWSTGDVSSTIVVSEPGVVELTVSGTDGCLNTVSAEITEVPLPVFTISGISYFCENESTLLEVTPGYSEYLWSNGETGTQVVISQEGIYYIEVLNQGICSRVDSIMITEKQLPSVAMSSFAADTLCFQSAGPMILSGSPQGGIFSGDAMTDNIFNPQMAEIGMNYVSYTYSDLLGCSASVTDSIFLDQCTGIAITQNNTGLNVYPNPTESIVNIEVLAEFVTGDLYVRNALGQEIKKVKIQGANNKMLRIDLTANPAGVYFISFDHNGRTENVRVVKK